MPEAKIDILIVDDNPHNVIALGAMLESLGQNLVRAESGTQALRHLLTRDFALVLLDIQMPGLDGFETAQIIRSRERSRSTHIIFLTAYSKDDAQILQAYELGAVDFLFKPVIPSILRSKVQVFVDLYRQTLEIQRQAARLREIEHREHDRQLAAATQRWEAERLREEMIQERTVAATLAKTVAEREQAEVVLQVRNRELADAGRRKDEFLAMLAHELRNPLAPIVNAIQLLRVPGTSEAASQRALDALERQSGHMVRLVDDLLDLSRITHGKIELRRERVQLAAIVSHAIQTSAPFIDPSEHRLEALLPAGEITLFADATRLSQVLANLLNNAAKYSPPGSPIQLTAEVAGGEILLRVRDHGIGIRPELLEEIFGLFVQFDRAVERAQGGLGIGLTLVRNLVELHGGSVRAHSAGLGQGSEFLVRLPVAPSLSLLPPASLLAAPPAAPLRTSAHPHRVTLVEDNEDIRETMKDLLERWGHEVTFAVDGPSGVEAVLAARPDIAFIDIGLPELDGYQVVAAIRARAPGLASRLVAVTGYGRPQDRTLALSAGFDDHLVKPVSSQALFALIEAC